MTPSALRFARLLAPAALALTLVACTGSPAITPLPSGGDPPSDCATVDADGVISLSAADLEFSAPCMIANAGEAFVIRFTNDEAVPHNVAVYADSSKGNELMRGEIITGPDKTVDYPVDALDAGEYFFDCIVHPAMQGALYVVEP